ncbi:hypothetical protein BaRGS_00038489 [Batillaria attramentaria]|uniref:Uncharacterized protein n=1 Tax=Batillaria attramentaria TaxID=370345 RepID=A0ABD0J622_9CAEN
MKLKTKLLFLIAALAICVNVRLFGTYLSGKSRFTVPLAKMFLRNSINGVFLVPGKRPSSADLKPGVAIRSSEGLNAVSNIRNNLLSKKQLPEHFLQTVLANDLQDDIEEQGAVPLLTLFSTWLDPPDADHDLIRNLTLRNWAQLKPLIVPVVFTNSSRVASRAEENGWHVLPISQTAVGVPILKYMYLDVMAR